MPMVRERPSPAAAPPTEHVPDLAKLEFILSGMEGRIARVRHFIFAMTWAVKEMRETYGADRFFCDAFDSVAEEAQDYAATVFCSWEEALVCLTGPSATRAKPAD